VSVAGSLPYPGPSDTFKFNVVLIGCGSAVITTVAIPDVTYTINDAVSSPAFSFTDFSPDLGACYPFAYAAALQDGSSLPSLITFDDSGYSFSIDTTQISWSTIYDIRLTGTMQVYPSTAISLDFVITTIGCDATVITPSTVAD
jgi:hypothetical protein